MGSAGRFGASLVTIFPLASRRRAQSEVLEHSIQQEEAVPYCTWCWRSTLSSSTQAFCISTNLFAFQAPVQSQFVLSEV